MSRGIKAEKIGKKNAPEIRCKRSGTASPRRQSKQDQRQQREQQQEIIINAQNAPERTEKGFRGLANGL